LPPPLLVLDLDETLIVASPTPGVLAGGLQVCGYSIKTRPYLRDFLLACADRVQIAVWSSSSDERHTI